MRQRSWIFWIISLVMVLGAAGTAQALTVFYTDAIGMTGTNWTNTLGITKFNPGLGTLTGIDFLLTGGVQGSIRFESLDEAATTISTGLQAMITLKRPDNSTIVVTTPASNFVDNVSSYDGLTDYIGTSGRTYAGLSASANSSKHSPPPNSDLALFTGVGTIFLPVSAIATSYASGSGNLQTIFVTDASAELKVTYTYNDTPPVPEPSSLALLLMGGGVVALGARRKLRK